MISIKRDPDELAILLVESTALPDVKFRLCTGPPRCTSADCHAAWYRATFGYMHDGDLLQLLECCSPDVKSYSASNYNNLMCGLVLRDGIPLRQALQFYAMIKDFEISKALTLVYNSIYDHLAIAGTDAKQT